MTVLGIIICLYNNKINKLNAYIKTLKNNKDIETTKVQNGKDIDKKDDEIKKLQKENVQFSRKINQLRNKKQHVININQTLIHKTKEKILEHTQIIQQLQLELLEKTKLIEELNNTIDMFSGQKLQDKQNLVKLHEQEKQTLRTNLNNKYNKQMQKFQQEHQNHINQLHTAYQNKFEQYEKKCIHLVDEGLRFGLKVQMPQIKEEINENDEE